MTQHHLPRIVLLAAVLGLGVRAAAQELAPAIDTSARFEGLFLDRPSESGALWARGTTYKLGFEKGRAIYVPLFGSRAPRSYPLELELRSLRCGAQPITLAAPSAPSVEGARIAIERAPLVETWDLEPERAEQSFVLDAPLGTGALELRLALRTDLLLREQGPGELVFEQPSLGVVRYGEAVAIDARGERAALALTIEEGEIALRVPAEFLANASYPLVIDPVLRTFAIDTAATDTTEPDAAYDATNDVWLVVCRERLSQTDSDIRCHRYSGDGATRLDTVYAESASNFAHSPSVASCAAAGRFLVVWSESDAFDRVRCRERHASSATQESAVVVFPGDLTRSVGATDVGGSGAGSDRFLIVFQLTDPSFAVPDISVMGAGYRIGGSVVPPGPISNAVGCTTAPRVSKDSGPHGRWIATWNRNNTSPCGSDDILFAIVSENFLVVQNPTPLAAPLLGRDLRPAAAGDGESFFLVWQRDDAVPRTQSDIVGARIARPRGSWIQDGPVIPLSQLEPGVALAADQTAPSIAFDGCRYVYAYSESNAGGVPRPFAATFLDTGSSIVFHEGHLALSNAASGVAHSSVKLAPQRSGGGAPGEALGVWQQIGNGGRDISGALIDIRATSGGITTLDTSCPNRTLRTTLGTNDVPALGRSFSLAMSNVQGAPLLLFGLPTTPLPLCTNATSTCSLGVALPALVVLPFGSVNLTIPCDALLVGGTVAVQGIDVGAGLGCPTALFGVPFRTTETLLITVQ
ncbi:MAG: hypothetical protein JNM84_13890 [Planctomycetes bacterium]|nr:hypothetical protein [Planctomycetota bacterium]